MPCTEGARGLHRGRTEQQQEYFNERKLTVFPDMIMAVAGMR